MGTACRACLCVAETLQSQPVPDDPSPGLQTREARGQPEARPSFCSRGNVVHCPGND